MSETTQTIREMSREYDQMEAAYQAQIANAARVISVLMGRNKNRKITPDQWEKSYGVQVGLEDDDDGGLVVRVQRPEPSDAD